MAVEAPEPFAAVAQPMGVAGPMSIARVGRTPRALLCAVITPESCLACASEVVAGPVTGADVGRQGKPRVETRTHTCTLRAVVAGVAGAHARRAGSRGWFAVSLPRAVCWALVPCELQVVVRDPFPVACHPSSTAYSEGDLQPLGLFKLSWHCVGGLTEVWRIAGCETASESVGINVRRGDPVSGAGRCSSVGPDTPSGLGVLDQPAASSPGVLKPGASDSHRRLVP